MKNVYTYNATNDGAVLAVVSDDNFFYIVDLLANERWDTVYDSDVSADVAAARYMDETYGADGWAR